MIENYTYAKIKRATQMMLDETHHYTDAQICDRTGIVESQIKQWRDRWGEIEKMQALHACNHTTLKYISNLTYGVSEAVWNDWLIAIDERLGEINGTDITGEIRAILEEIARIINERYPNGRGVTREMIERAVLHFVDALRDKRLQCS